MIAALSDLERWISSLSLHTIVTDKLVHYVYRAGLPEREKDVVVYLSPLQFGVVVKGHACVVQHARGLTRFSS